MKHFLLTAAAVFIISASQAPLRAQSVWSLQQCIDYALDNNLQLKQKKLAVEQSDVEIYSAKGQLLPSLSFATNQNGSWRPWSNSYVNLSNGSMSSTTSTVNYNGSYGLQASWTIWNGGRNLKQVQRDKLSKEQSEADREMTALSLEEQIVQLYVQILYQTEAVNVSNQILESTAVQLEQAKAMYEVGTMSRADLAQVESQVSQERLNVTNATTQLAQYKMQLRQLLEIPADSDFGVAVPQIDDSHVLTILPPVADVYAAAAANRPELRYSRLGIEAADVDINLAKRGYYPTISLSAGVNTNASSGLDKVWTKQIQTNLSNSLGLSISVPIFDNRSNRSNVARAKISKANSEVALAQQERTLYNDIETFHLNAQSAQQQYTYASASVKSMQESYDLVSEQFALGLKDVVDLTTAKNNLIQAEQQMLQAKYTAVLNRALLDFYRGMPLTLN